MKNAINVATFQVAINAKVAKANELGTKTTWSTEDHLAALAKAIAQATDPEHDEAYVAIIQNVLTDGYNISALQQGLEKAYEKSGHFQRKGQKKQSVSEFYAGLNIPA